jgi:hypothetical protein
MTRPLRSCIIFSILSYARWGGGVDEKEEIIVKNRGESRRECESASMSVSVSDRELEETPIVDEKMERRKSDAT